MKPNDMVYVHEKDVGLRRLSPTYRAAKSRPTLPGPGKAVQVNWAYFNEIAFSIGDAQLQVHGFVLVVIGSVVGSYGDLILRYFFAGYF
jgi:hypothetical protein